MKLIIDIDEKLYKDIQTIGIPIGKIAYVLKAIKSGTPLDDVLNKIRAEIEQITDTMGVSYNQYVSKIDVLQIIDKYKAESEDGNNER